MVLTLDEKCVLDDPSDLRQIDSKIKVSKMSYPVYLDPVTSEMHVCIFWALNRFTNHEYYAFEVIKGSFKRPKGITYRGVIMGEETSYGEFRRADFDPALFDIADDVESLNTISPPQYRVRGDDEKTIEWHLVDVPIC